MDISRTAGWGFGGTEWRSLFQLGRSGHHGSPLMLGFFLKRKSVTYACHWCQSLLGNEQFPVSTMHWQMCQALSPALSLLPRHQVHSAVGTELCWCLLPSPQGKCLESASPDTFFESILWILERERAISVISSEMAFLKKRQACLFLPALSGYYACLLSTRLEGVNLLQVSNSRILKW